MTNEKILKKAIEKAVGNGWRLPNHDYYEGLDIEGMLFDPEFAKAFWGEDKTIRCRTRIVNEELNTIDIERWRYYQSEMLDEIQAGLDPIKYLGQFI